MNYQSVRWELTTLKVFRGEDYFCFHCNRLLMKGETVSRKLNNGTVISGPKWLFKCGSCKKKRLSSSKQNFVETSSEVNEDGNRTMKRMRSSRTPSPKPNKEVIDLRS